LERLDITSVPEMPDIEASIHFARYAIAMSLVKDKKVLDIACGEGYGSYLFKRAGAKEVVGVDVSADAINRARKSFEASGIKFVLADAAIIEERYSAEYFDVVVSCETIEHIDNPNIYLQSLKKLAKKDALFIITCPNDYWYYPEDHQNNPYHLRKYRFKEFQKLATSVLGENVTWSIGTAVFGFGSTPMDVRQGYVPIPDSWMSFREIDGAYLVNGGDEQKFSDSNCSYFIGVWNAAEMPIGTAVFPVSMDCYSRMLPAMDGRLQQRENISLIGSMTEVNVSERDLRSTRLHFQAAMAENEVLRERLQAYKGDLHTVQSELEVCRVERDQMRVAHDRYVWLRSFVPQPIRTLTVKFVRMIRGKI